MSVIYHPAFQNSDRVYPRFEDPGSLSVVICARNQLQDLRNCLAALACQTRKVNEIIVVDLTNEPADVAAMCQVAEVDYMRAPQNNIDSARNAGAAAAQSTIVAYLDDLGLPRADWAHQLLVAFDSPDIDAVAGCVRPTRLDTFAQILFERRWSVANKPYEQDFTEADFLGSGHHAFPAWRVGSGANMAFRRSSFARYGLFDPALNGRGTQTSAEAEYLYRILGQGGFCRYSPDIVVWQRHADNEAALKPLVRAKMRGHIASLRAQAQRFPGRGNWRRILVTLPACFLRRSISRLRWGRDQNTWFLLTEIRGYFDGLFCSIGQKRRRLN